MSEIVLREIVIIVNDEDKKARDKLLTEENGRVVASLQGNVYGWRQLIEFMTSEFIGLESVTFGLDGTQKPMVMADLSDDDVLLLESLVLEFMESYTWKLVKVRVDERIGQLKDHLLYSAEKSRELDIAQGQYKALVWLNRFFSDVVSAANFRRQKLADDAKRRKEELNFDGNPEGGPAIHQAGESTVSSTCPSCGGTCYTGSEDNREPCEACGGTGLVHTPKAQDNIATCPDCKGSGNVHGLDLSWGPCVTCQSTGKVDAKEATEETDK